ncbi:hypothetical protein BC832DRAFT_548586 [Gaertneriomyces semiglobifer]|nr:hypothetical protein BC832DRAFT_548586 [Gaertneriomyces semiglobifer]
MTEVVKRKHEVDEGDTTRNAKRLATDSNAMPRQKHRANDTDDYIPPAGNSVNPSRLQPQIFQTNGQSPWVPPGRLYTGTLEQRLSQEIEDFVNVLSETPEHSERRQNYIALIKNAFKVAFPNMRFELFGSSATGLSLPGADIDIVIIDDQQPAATQKAAASQLKRIKSVMKPFRGQDGVCQILGKARVPILKIQVTETERYNVDISFQQLNATDGVAVTRTLLSRQPLLRPLVFVLKVFMKCRGLNNPATNGIGGYAIVLWLASFLEIHPIMFPSHPSTAGQIFLDFLLFFGRVFDYWNVGLRPSQRGTGVLFDKNNGPHYKKGCAGLLSIEDPVDPAVDPGLPFTSVPEATGHFSACWDWLHAEFVERGGRRHSESKGLLGGILSLDEPSKRTYKSPKAQQKQRSPQSKQTPTKKKKKWQDK